MRLSWIDGTLCSETGEPIENLMSIDARQVTNNREGRLMQVRVSLLLDPEEYTKRPQIGGALSSLARVLDS